MKLPSWGNSPLSVGFAIGLRTDQRQISEVRKGVGGGLCPEWLALPVGFGGVAIPWFAFFCDVYLTCLCEEWGVNVDVLMTLAV